MTKTFKDYLKEAETSESGLQYYTGVQKDGKEYMKKAAKAGREGASQEELGRLKDKYSKAQKNKKTTEDDMSTGTVAVGKKGKTRRATGIDDNPYDHNDGEDQTALVNAALWNMKDVYQTVVAGEQLSEDDIFSYGDLVQYIDMSELPDQYNQFWNLVTDAINSAGGFAGQGDSLEVDKNIAPKIKTLYQQFKAATTQVKGVKEDSDNYAYTWNCEKCSTQNEFSMTPQEKQEYINDWEADNQDLVADGETGQGALDNLLMDQGAESGLHHGTECKQCGTVAEDTHGESDELTRIKSLSGIQTEGHGPEVDGFLEKLASMDDDQAKYETAEKAYAGGFGPKIQQAIQDMYNEAKKSVGDMDDIMDDVLDMIEKDYGPKEDVGVDEAEDDGFDSDHPMPSILKYDYQPDVTRALRKAAGLPDDAPVYFDDADLVYGDKTVWSRCGIDDNCTFGDAVTALKKFVKANPVEEENQELDRIKELAGASIDETYDDDDDFYEAYGEMWYNEDDIVDEAEYQGRKVKLGKPMQGDVKKFKVYVKDPKTGNTKKVNFGHGGSSVKGKAMSIKKSNPARRKSFRARHNCDNPGPRTKARYWSCRKW